MKQIEAQAAAFRVLGTHRVYVTILRPGLPAMTFKVTKKEMLYQLRQLWPTTNVGIEEFHLNPNDKALYLCFDPIFTTNDDTPSFLKRQAD